MPNNIHGKNAVLYLGAGGGTPILITEQADWSIDMDIALADTSQLNNTWKDFVKGMLGYTITFSGNFNIASNQIWLAGVSDFAESFYLYQTSAAMTRYYYGTVWITPTKLAAGSTTTKASSAFKGTGSGALSKNP